METITNEEKARKIVEYYETRYNDTRDLQWYDLEDIARQAMQWKDEQHEQEKQQWIEKAVIFLNERVCMEMSIPEIHNTIVDFRKLMEG